MSKSTELSVEQNLPSALSSYKESAAAVKGAHKATRQAILDDPRRSDAAKKDDLAALSKDTRTKLDGLKDEQAGFIKGLRDKIESELRGNQPSDANSVLLRRDAADRARKIADNREAMSVLQDAINNGDESMAHAVGGMARRNVWRDVAEAYQAAHPDTADSAAALQYVEEVTSGPAFNVANSATFSDPLD